LLHLQLILLQLIDFVSDKFHLLNLLRDLVLDLLGCSTLIVKFCPKRVHNLIKAVIRLPRRCRPKIGIATMLSGVKHDECNEVGQRLDNGERVRMRQPKSEVRRLKYE